jgi:hypothetical protein
VRTVGGDVLLDVVAERNSQLSFFDAKNGPSAGFTPNQKPGIPRSRAPAGQFFGPNAATYGLSGSFGAQPVYIIGYP